MWKPIVGAEIHLRKSRMKPQCVNLVKLVVFDSPVFVTKGEGANVTG